MLDLKLTPGVAPAAQIRAQLTNMIRNGELVNGARLPSIRALAENLGVAPGTVARVYRELEDSGLIESRPRHGSRVIGVSAAEEACSKLARDFVASAQTAGLSLERAHEMVGQLWVS